MDNLIPTKTIKENGVIAIKNGIKPNSNKLIPIERKPTWLRVKSHNSSKYRELKEIVAIKSFIPFAKRQCVQISKNVGVMEQQLLCYWVQFVLGPVNFVL